MCEISSNEACRSKMRYLLVENQIRDSLRKHAHGPEAVIVAVVVTVVLTVVIVIIQARGQPLPNVLQVSEQARSDEPCFAPRVPGKLIFEVIGPLESK